MTAYREEAEALRSRVNELEKKCYDYEKKEADTRKARKKTFWKVFKIWAFFVSLTGGIAIFAWNIYDQYQKTPLRSTHCYIDKSDCNCFDGLVVKMRLGKWRSDPMIGTISNGLTAEQIATANGCMLELK